MSALSVITASMNGIAKCSVEVVFITMLLTPNSGGGYIWGSGFVQQRR
jgi:hypothetical protein